MIWPVRWKNWRGGTRRSAITRRPGRSAARRPTSWRICSEPRASANEGVAILEDLTRERPDSGRHLGCLGRALMSQGRTKEAQKILTAAEAANREAIQQEPRRRPGAFQPRLRLVHAGEAR